MLSTTADKKSGANLVGMGQTALVESGDIARAVLGSCIGLVLFHQHLHVAAVAHIVLPKGVNREGPRGKFADTAIPFMLELIAEKGGHRHGLIAKLAGGSNMLNGKGAMQIGALNQEAVTSQLQKLKIPIAGQHLGGDKGRRIEFRPATGELIIDVVGEPSVEI